MGDNSLNLTEVYGRRLMTSVIDDRARSNPQKTFMSIPAGKSVIDGQRDISYGDLAQAIHCSAWWIEETLGKGVDFPPIATYLHPTDFRHVLLTFGAIKSGYKMFYSSPRNRPEVQVALLEKLQCTTLFTPEDESETTKAVLERRQMNKYTLPDLDFFLNDEPVEPYPYNKTFEQARKDPYVTLHSSGSTGTPKVLNLKQGYAAAHDAFQLLPSLGDTPWTVSTWAGKRVLTNFPWVHAGGAHIIPCGIYNDFVTVIPAAWPLTGADANHLHVHANVQAAWFSPSVLIDIARNPTFLENITKLTNVSYSGGILPAHVGDAISKRTRVFGNMASTETGILPGEMPPPDMWNYYKFNKRLGHTFRHYDGDLFELVYTRDKANESFQAVFFTFLDADTYEMRDVYIEHPTHKGWWRSSGRIDDVVVMSDAKKLNTIPYEAAIERHPGIATALMCGTGRPRPAILLQPSRWPETKEEERRLVDATWPTIEKANEAGPVLGRLIKELVVVARQSKPFVKAGGKDTVMRFRSLQLYEDEIDEAYKRAEEKGFLYGDVADKGNLV
ncbi:hypothetical protein TruAng_001221 [Truncatella angustata]|nr:hypothetical protein TruAng_001221 [Truncatella angustata]